jgi:hypothetical protein
MSRIKIYLSGPITGHPNYKAEFKEAEEKVRKIFKKEYKEVIIINPCDKPWNVEDGMRYEECIIIDYACIDICDIVVLIPGYDKSPGSRRELARNDSLDKKSYVLETMIKAIAETDNLQKDVSKIDDIVSEYAEGLLEEEDET